MFTWKLGSLLNMHWEFCCCLKHVAWLKWSPPKDTMFTFLFCNPGSHASLHGMTRILVGLLLIEEPIYENLDACKHGLSWAFCRLVHILAIFAAIFFWWMWTSGYKVCLDEGACILRILTHASTLHQKKKIGLEITAKIASVNGPLFRRSTHLVVNYFYWNISPFCGLGITAIHYSIANIYCQHAYNCRVIRAHWFV